MDQQLRITEIFYSLQGETNTVGIPTVFVRLTGCPLRCSYCDTAYAFSGGEKLAIGDILAEIRRYNTRYVTVTGGEPLAQPGCQLLLIQLADAGYSVSLETSGALDVAAVDSRVVKVVDLKRPVPAKCSATSTATSIVFCRTIKSNSSSPMLPITTGRNNKWSTTDWRNVAKCCFRR